jgi:hypothetical protein
MAGRKVVSPATVTAIQPEITPAWIRPTVLALAAVLLLSWFTGEVRDSDAWWHLKTGEYLWQQHKLPKPDPFAYTTYLNPPVYPGEERVRDFNLTHSWLSQLFLYLAYRAAGFPGLVLLRAVLLIAFCSGVGLVVWHRTQGFYRAVLASIGAGAVAIRFTSDRPFLFGFVFLAATIVILEYRRWLWLLPPLFVVWANAHGGYFLGWIPLVAYCADSLLRREPIAEQRRLWIVTGIAIVASGLNPNGFRAIWVLVAYRSSAMQTAIAEWGMWAFWTEWRGAFLISAALFLVISYRKVRPVDWILFVLFAAAAISAVRNVILVGYIAPMVIAVYIPWRRFPRAAEFAVIALLVARTGLEIAGGSAFQLRAADWRYPSGAAEFLLSRNISGKMFNSYDSGGYLIWRMWPKQQVFIDGRALNESLFPDYQRIVQTADEALLKKYSIDIILIEGFSSTGGINLLPAILSDPSQKEWKLVYQNAQATLFLRHPPPGMPVLNSGVALISMESQCSERLTHDPEHPGCAQALATLFTQIGDTARAAKWRGF